MRLGLYECAIACLSQSSPVSLVGAWGPTVPSRGPSYQDDDENEVPRHWQDRELNSARYLSLSESPGSHRLGARPSHGENSQLRTHPSHNPSTLFDLDSRYVGPKKQSIIFPPTTRSIRTATIRYAQRQLCLHLPVTKRRPARVLANVQCYK